MAEYVLAGFLYFAKGFHQANRDKRRHGFDHTLYRSLLLEGKTVCVVGAGGIGMEVARLCVGAGMRVVGTRRHTPRAGDQLRVFSRIEGPGKLYDLLEESHFVAVCCQWTPETTKLIDHRAFDAMNPETVLVNVARGEIIDEEALIEALDAKKIRGVALDVYVGEFDREPDRRLWDDDRVLITPHISSITEISQHRGVELFCENLKAYLEGREMINVIEWERGY
jgi:phosphoglycerate dehydrogenase-like enzyme